VTACSMFKANGRFGGTCRLCLPFGFTLVLLGMETSCRQTTTTSHVGQATTHLSGPGNHPAMCTRQPPTHLGQATTQQYGPGNNPTIWARQPPSNVRQATTHPSEPGNHSTIWARQPPNHLGQATTQPSGPDNHPTSEQAGTADRYLSMIPGAMRPHGGQWCGCVDVWMCDADGWLSVSCLR
jgi:hypothetical protein